MEHVVGAGEVQAGAAGLERQDEHRRSDGAGLELGHHAVALGERRAAVQEQDLAVERLAQIGLQQAAHLGVLREDQRALVGGQDLFQHLPEPRQLARAAGERAAVVHQQRGMIADLLESSQQRQHQAATLHAFGLGDLAHRVLQDGLVERRLLAGERAVHLHLVLLGQVGDDGAVGLEAPQDERRGERLEARRGVGVGGALDGHGELAPELLGRAEIARVDDLEDAPQIGQAVFHRRARQRHPPARGQRARRLRRAGRGVLDVLRLVEHESFPLDARQAGLVAVQERIRTQHHIVLRRHHPQLLARRPPRPMMHEHLQPRRKPRQLVPPVADHRRRTDHQRRPRRLAEQQRNELRRFSQPHVVGQQGAEAVALEGGEPGDAAFLVAAQGADEAFGFVGDLDAGAGLDILQQGVDPAAGFDLGDLDAVEGGRGQRGGQRVGQLHLGALVLLNEGQRAFDLIRLDVDPAAAQLDQRLFELRQHLELVAGEGLVAEGELPVVGDQAVERQQRRTVAAARLRFARSAQAQANVETRVEPWQQHPEAAGLEQQRLVAHQVRRLARRERARLGTRRVQAGLDRGKDPRRPTQRAKHSFMRLVEPARQEARGATAVAPHLAHGHQQAGIVGGLQQVLQAPRAFAGDRLGGLGRDQAEAHAEGVVGVSFRGEIGPGGNLAAEATRDVGRQHDRRVVAAERGEPGAHTGRQLGLLAGQGSGSRAPHRRSRPRRSRPTRRGPTAGWRPPARSARCWRPAWNARSPAGWRDQPHRRSPATSD